MEHVKRKSYTNFVEGKKKTRHWFTINAKNGKILVTSEIYKTKVAMENGISALKLIMADYE